jgi:iron complex transport system ATP-binding protein
VSVFPPIIDIRNATVYRGPRQVFSNLSLEIPFGCQTAILGPNGAGKSTLLKLLSGELYPISQGGSHVRILGEERWNVWELRRKLGIISHDLQHQYLDHVPGIRVMLSGYYASIDTYVHQRFTDVDIERANQIMKRLDISALKERLFGEMSTGEQRRFLLGRALIHDPCTLVLDEPTSGLDLRSCFEYLSIIRDLIQQGKTILLVTHHVHEIPPEVSRVVLLRQGEVIADGAKHRILTSEHLGALFETPVQIVEANGFYQAMPSQ